MNEILLEVIKGIFWTVAGGIFGYYFSRYRSREEQIQKIKKTRESLVERSHSEKNSRNVFAIENGNPVFDIADIDVRKSGKSLIVEIPEHFKPLLLENDPKFEFRQAISYDGSNRFDDLVKTTKIPDLIQRISKHSDLVGKSFISRQNQSQILFNGGMFGIYKVSRHRVGRHENSELSIQTYNTDFFTYQVFSSIYRELKEERHPISQVEKLEEFKNADVDYSPFLTSFGICTFVLLNDDTTVVLAERSPYITHNERKYHYSMNEAFSQTDTDENRPSLHKCICRGLREELNIREGLSFSHPIKILDLLFNRDKFEMGISSVISFPDLTFEQLKNLYQSAADGRLETQNLVLIELNEKSVNSFLSTHQMTSGSELALKLLLSRTSNIGLNKF